MTATATTHQQAMITAWREQLEVLELQAAKLGLSTPPHVLTQIDDLRSKLASEVEDVPEEERIKALMRAVMLLGQQLTAVETKFDRQLSAVEVKVDRLWRLALLLPLLYLVGSRLLEYLP